MDIEITSASGEPLGMVSAPSGSIHDEETVSELGQMIARSAEEMGRPGLIRVDVTP